MRISDWSSDVCSSDLVGTRTGQDVRPLGAAFPRKSGPLEKGRSRRTAGGFDAGLLKPLQSRHPGEPGDTFVITRAAPGCGLSFTKSRMPTRDPWRVA